MGPVQTKLLGMASWLCFIWKKHGNCARDYDWNNWNLHFDCKLCATGAKTKFMSCIANGSAFNFSGGTCTSVTMNGKSHHIVANPMMTQIVLPIADMAFPKQLPKAVVQHANPECFRKAPYGSNSAFTKPHFQPFAWKGFDCHLQLSAENLFDFNLALRAQKSSVSCVMSRKTCIIAVCWHCFGHINTVLTLEAANSQAHIV